MSLAGIAPAHDRDDMRAAECQGFDSGYRDGLDHGSDDRARNESFDFQSADYERADRGYSPDVGLIEDFRIGYREGYRPGYEDGFSGRRARYEVYQFDEHHRSGRDDRAYDERPAAPYDAGFDFGYRDGVEAARQDIAKHKSFRPTKHYEYSNASHGYNKHLHGDKGSYKIRYRQGFVRGYEEEFPRPS